VTASDPRAGRPPLLPAIVGITLAALLFLTLGLWTAARRNSTGPRPIVTILAPATDTVTHGGALSLYFQSTVQLRLQPAGWGSGRYHLHALVNGQERMPAAADITSTRDGSYLWRLTDLPDSAAIQLVWALPNHVRLPDGASRIILIRHARP
jgi:hypothetical protein